MATDIDKLIKETNVSKPKMFTKKNLYEFGQALVAIATPIFFIIVISFPMFIIGFTLMTIGDQSANKSQEVGLK